MIQIYNLRVLQHNNIGSPDELLDKLEVLGAPAGHLVAEDGGQAHHRGDQEQHARHVQGQTRLTQLVHYQPRQRRTHECGHSSHGGHEAKGL